MQQEKSADVFTLSENHVSLGLAELLGKKTHIANELSLFPHLII